MTLKHIVGPMVMAALVSTSVPARAEEHEGVLVARPVLAARPIGSGVAALGDRQLVQLPSPVYPMPSKQIPMRAFAWTAISVAALFAYVRVTTPTR
jgi:hypothetical protein